MNFKEKINNCNSIDQLNHLKQSINQSSYQGTTNYDKQKHIEEIGSLNKLIEAKRANLTDVRFKFQGDPMRIETTHDGPIKSFTVEPYKKQFKLQKLQFDEPVNYLLLEDFSHSVIINKFKSQAVNLQKASNSVIYIETNGTIILSNLNNCVLKLKCHQLRIHHTHNCTFIVESNHNDREVIFENCTNLKFNKGTRVADFGMILADSNNYSYLEETAEFTDIDHVLTSQDKTLSLADIEVLNNL